MLVSKYRQPIQTQAWAYVFAVSSGVEKIFNAGGTVAATDWDVGVVAAPADPRLGVVSGIDATVVNDGVAVATCGVEAVAVAPGSGTDVISEEQAN